MVEVATNFTTTGRLLESVYSQLAQYRAHSSLTDTSGATVFTPLSPSSTPSSASFILFTAVQSLASQLANQSTGNFSNSITHTSPAWSSEVTLFDGNLPMPTDEASLNTELGLGPVRDPLWTAIPMTVLYVLILVTGVVGNVVTCMVIARNRYMHTATNYYLFSLAISDLLLLVLGLPQEIQQIWQRYPYAFGEVFCILRGFSSEASTNSSVLTITAFTMERYIAICHPLKAHTMSKLSRAVKLIVIIWLLGFLCAAPIAYQFGIVFDYVHDEVLIPQSATCNIKRPVPYLEEHIFALQSLMCFVLPVTLISVLYVLIGVKLRQRTQTQGEMSRTRRKPIRRFQSGSNTTYITSSSIESIDYLPTPNGNNSDVSLHSKVKEMASLGSESVKFQPNCEPLRPRPRLTKFTSSQSSASSTSGNSLAQRRAVIKMLTAVVVAFFVCFAPFHAQRLMAIYVKNPSNYEKFAFNLLTYISGVTYYLSATVNPILYSIMSVRFRQAFHDTFVRTMCPSKSDKFSYRGRSMSQMYHSTYRPTSTATTVVNHSIHIGGSILASAASAPSHTFQESVFSVPKINGSQVKPAEQTNGSTKTPVNTVAHYLTNQSHDTQVTLISVVP